MAINESLLTEGLLALGLSFSIDAQKRLVKYIEEIELWNETYGLVNATGDELIIKHILDSLAPLALIQEKLSHFQTPVLADAGTGAGLPGIPLAIALSETPLYLVDRMGKRIRFLENQKALLPLANVSILESEIERVKKTFSVISFRAFRPLEKPIIKALFNMLDDVGYLAAYKGKRSKIDEELLSAGKDIGLAEIIKIEVPFLNEERHMVFIQKK